MAISALPLLSIAASRSQYSPTQQWAGSSVRDFEPGQAWDAFTTRWVWARCHVGVIVDIPEILARRVSGSLIESRNYLSTKVTT